MKMKKMKKIKLCLWILIVGISTLLLSGMSIKSEKEGYIYVADGGNSRIQIFDRNGKFIKAFGKAGTGVEEFTRTEIPGPPGTYISVLFLGIDGKYLYVLDVAEKNVKKYTKEGDFVSTSKYDQSNISGWDINGNIYIKESNGVLNKLKDNKVIQTFSNFVYNDNLNKIVTDKYGNMYIIDNRERRILKFDTAGKLVKEFGEKGDKIGQFFIIRGLAIDEEGNIIIGDSYNNRIQIYDKEFKFIKMFEMEYNNIDIYHMDVACIDKKGNIYMFYLGNVICKFSKTGKLLMKFGDKGTGEGQFVMPTNMVVDF